MFSLGGPSRFLCVEMTSNKTVVVLAKINILFYLLKITNIIYSDYEVTITSTINFVPKSYDWKL